MSRATTYDGERVRRAITHFIVGKGLSAAANLTVTVILVRSFTVRDYAAFVLMMGLVMTLSRVASPGLREVLQRYVPPLIVRRRHQEAGALMGRLLLLQTAAVALVAAALLAAAGPLSVAFGYPEYAVSVRLTALLLFSSVVSSFLLLLLETLLMQRIVKWLWIGMALVRLGCVAFLAMPGLLDLNALLLVDSAMYLAVCLPAAAGMVMDRRASRRSPGQEVDDTADRGRMVPFAAWNYMLILSMAFQGSAMHRILAAGLLPAAVTAPFGLSQNLSDNVERYLPNMLLLNIMRPVFMAGFSNGRDFGRLNLKANLFFKLNLALLVPVLAVTALYGGPLLEWIAGGPMPHAGSYLLCLVGILALDCHNRSLEVLAHAAELPRLLFWGNGFKVLLPLAAATQAHQFGIWGILFATGLGCLLRDAYVAVRLRAAGIESRTDWPGWCRLAAAGATVWLVMAWWVPEAASPAVLMLLSALAVALYIPAAMVCRPFTAPEIDLMGLPPVARRLASRLERRA